MLQIHDIRQSRAYQEAVAAGMKQGLKVGMKQGMEKGIAIARLPAEKKSVAEIAALLQLNVDLVREVLAQVDRA